MYDDVKDIDFNNLPAEKVFFKANHTSGYNAIYDKNRKFDMWYFKKKFSFILKQNYYYVSREWNYKNIPAKIVSEKVFDSEGLLDYRFLCFNGKVKIIFVDSETTNSDGTHHEGAKRNIYDENFNLIDLKIGRENFTPEQARKPHNLKVMIEYAERLAKPFPFVRVDLYNIKGEILFGEMTFYSGGASQEFSSEEWAVKMGNWIDISSI